MRKQVLYTANNKWNFWMISRFDKHVNTVGRKCIQTGQVIKPGIETKQNETKQSH